MTEPRNRIEAKLLYRTGDFDVIQSGDHVRCAVTGEPMTVDQLTYWNAELQEAYSAPEHMIARLRELKRI
jgi:hypothetical protein